MLLCRLMTSAAKAAEFFILCLATIYLSFCSNCDSLASKLAYCYYSLCNSWDKVFSAYQKNVLSLALMNTFYAASSRSFHLPSAKLARGTGTMSDLKTVPCKRRLASIRSAWLLLFNRENIIIRKLINELTIYSCAINVNFDG
jgi:hypothetical protein